MPGKKFKSIGIREKLYNRIEEEKREGESISDYIDRIIDIAKGKEEDKKEGSGLTKEGLREVLKEVLGERKEQGNVTTTDTNAGITIEDLKKALLGLENDIDMKIRDMLNEVVNKL